LLVRSSAMTQRLKLFLFCRFLCWMVSNLAVLVCLVVQYFW
jgi:hypothetical protein